MLTENTAISNSWIQIMMKNIKYINLFHCQGKEISFFRTNYQTWKKLMRRKQNQIESEYVVLQKIELFFKRKTNNPVLRKT